jgi:hypothetical protein
MSGITVTFPPLEAMALAKQLGGQGGMSAAECDAAQRGHQRIVSALTAEVGSYESGIVTIAESLIGEEVRLKTTYGKIFTGKLERLSGFRTAVIAVKPFSHPINLSLVESIEPVRSEVAA